MQTTIAPQQLFATTPPIVAPFFAVPTAPTRSANEIHFTKGEPLFQALQPNGRAYLVTQGEVLIVRDGRPIDLVEAGESLDATLWPNAIAIALTDGSLQR